MRKPLVVVCVTASAVLLAGAIAATTAGAETTSDQPEVPGVAVPGVPEVPQLPAGADQPSLDLPGLVAQAQDQADQGAPNDQGAAVDTPPAADAGAQRPGGPAVAPAQQPAQEQPAQEQPAQQQPAQQQAAQQRPAQQRPARDRPAQDRPAQERPAKQKPSIMAAAQQDVSPNSVSTSVDAPVQRQVLALVNGNRRRGGCGGLTLDRRLIVAAHRHAADMARRGYFAHESPSGDGAGQRVEDAGYRWSRYGENIARGSDSAYEVVDGWMHSPEHRENIMDCRLDQMGIGLAFAPDGTPYWVQDFATPK